MGEVMAFDHNESEAETPRSDADILRNMDRLLTLVGRLCDQLQETEPEGVDELRDCVAVGKIVVLRLAEEHEPRTH